MVPPRFTPSGEVISYVLYIINVLVIIIIVYRLYSEIRRSGLGLSISRLLMFIKYEASSYRKGMVHLMHLSILLGVSLSILFTLIYPLTYSNPIAHYVMFAISTPLLLGLITALAWRFKILGDSFRVYSKLKIMGGIRHRSIMLQSILMLVIALTSSTLALTIFTSATYVEVKLTLSIIDYVLIAAYYVKPEVNLYLNLDLDLPNLREAFNLRDVLEGKVDASQVKIGVERLSDLADYELRSLDACVEIGACEEACPATLAGRPLSPRMLIRKLKYVKDSNGGDADVFKVVLDDEVWSCTTCGACIYNCPIGVRHVDLIIDVRRRLVELSRLDQKKSTLLLNVTQYGNSMGVSNYGRHEWLRELGVKTVKENPSFKHLLWVGCMGSFDSRAREIVKSLVDIIKAAGLINEIAVLGDEEACCGDPLRRLGDEGRFQEVALSNIEVFKKYGVKSIITICPHGYNTFRNEYPKLDEYMRSVLVQHHTQFIAELIERGRVNVKRSGEVLTIHDPCYLARYNKSTKPQRIIVSSVGVLKEPKNSGENTFCCGAGGANYWYDVPEEKRISSIRLSQLTETGAKTIVTMCPFCNAMLSDAARVSGFKGRIIDVSELIKESMVGGH
ncbi:(Fe-S)-binding protein [Caldivirga sp. UBA161]|uniref:(Fe-S)-binding protein n=1 Tax=Caldivirga sp. UBA161 TaxID=1915569 RepID=UPI0025B8958F|nr:(Fe-S)-binding protein [Caldivirga sp. UBA161]